MNKETEIELNKEYFWKRTDGWDWFGVRRWWEVFVVITGFNGVGGFWVEECWRWNGSNQNIRKSIKSLSIEESLNLKIDLERENCQITKMAGLVKG